MIVQSRCHECVVMSDESMLCKVIMSVSMMLVVFQRRRLRGFYVRNFSVCFVSLVVLHSSAFFREQTRSRSPLSSCTIESHGLHDRHRVLGGSGFGKKPVIIFRHLHVSRHLCHYSAVMFIHRIELNLAARLKHDRRSAAPTK